MDKFYTHPGREKYYNISNIYDGELKNFYAAIELDYMISRRQDRKLPTFLDLENLGIYVCYDQNCNISDFVASLLMLAVISRPGLDLSVSDLVRMFNSEGLSWANSVTFIPPSYKLTGVERNRFRYKIPI